MIDDIEVRQTSCPVSVEILLEEVERLRALYDVRTPLIHITDDEFHTGRANRELWVIQLSQKLLSRPGDAWKIVLAHEFGHLVDRKTRLFIADD